jgi:N-acyl-L-homoserine lactone synthetase
VKIYDEVLEEIHRIQEKHFKKRRKLSWKEEARLIKKEVNHFLKEKNYAIISVNGKQILTKIK